MLRVFERPGNGIFHKGFTSKTHSSEFSGLRMRDGRASLNPVRGLTELSLVIRGPDILSGRFLTWRLLTRQASMYVWSIRPGGPLSFEAAGVFQRPGEGVENVGFHKDPGPKTHSSEFSGLRMVRMV